MVTIYGYTKCSTVKKAIKFLKDNNIKYEHIDNVENKFSKDKILEIYEKGKIAKKKLFNTSGMKYRELGLKDKVDNLSLEEAAELLSTDGMLVKRPILQTDEKILVGFKVKEWEDRLLEGVQ